ncbi:MAG TPA: hypothetical protein VKT77_15840, partial [Chthonomonadaceae bacterium]|nr:hypothetical protein [Chthonomonadaceae bacterium]
MNFHRQPNRLTAIGLALAALLSVPVLAAPAAKSAKPAAPRIVGLSVLPARLVLTDGRDARSIVVTGRTAEGISIDL